MKLMDLSNAKTVNVVDLKETLLDALVWDIEHMLKESDTEMKTLYYTKAHEVLDIAGIHLQIFKRNQYETMKKYIDKLYLHGDK